MLHQTTGRVLRSLNRRTFLGHLAASIPLAGALAAGGCGSRTRQSNAPLAGSAGDVTPAFRPEITLAQWSLHRAIFGGRLDPLEFPRAARSFGISGVEYVNQFYQSHSGGWAKELRSRCEGEGVRSHLIMCDGEGDIGAPQAAERATAVARHERWLAAAQELGCHSIRVNARSGGTPEEQRAHLVEGLRSLCDSADRFGLNVLVENHGGQSSDGLWLAGVLRAVDHPRMGSLPDFGNFRRSATEWEDRYRGVEALAPLARAMSAKSYDFDTDGNETTIDYPRMLRIAREAGYRGAIGIEYEGRRLSEPEGILATKRLVERAISVTT